MSTEDVGTTLKQRALQKHFERLADAITEPDRLASKLYSKGFITRGTRESITSTVGVSRFSKALQLLDVVEARVKNDPDAFKKFVRIVKSVHGLQAIGDAVLVSYRKWYTPSAMWSMHRASSDLWNPSPDSLLLQASS